LERFQIFAKGEGEIKSLGEQLVLLVQNRTTEQLPTLVQTHAKQSNLKMQN